MSEFSGPDNIIQFFNDDGGENSSGVVDRILAATATPRALPSTEDERARARLREHGVVLGGAPRSLEAYADALNASTPPEEPPAHGE